MVVQLLVWASRKMNNNEVSFVLSEQAVYL
jgi:hypothetical protein